MTHALKKGEKINLVIHLGYPKTGTTFLQQHVFPNIEYVNYLGKFQKKSSVHKKYFSMGDRDYHRFKQLFLERGRDQKLEDQFYACLDASRVNIFSSEDFSLPCNPQFSLTLRHFKKVFGNKCHIRVLISIRKQSSMLYSHFKHMQNHGRIKEIAKIEDAFANLMLRVSKEGSSSEKKSEEAKTKIIQTLTKPNHHPGFMHINPDNYKYHRMINLSKQLFGRENTHIICQESLENNNLEIYRKLIRFIQPKGLIQSLHNLKSHINKRENVGKKRRQEDKIKKIYQRKLAKELDRYFAHSNLATKKMTQIPLENYGYLCKKKRVVKNEKGSVNICL